MKGPARKLLDDALQLPEEERADLAYEIIASLDGESDADVERAWAEEIESRARRALANPDGGEDHKIVMARLRARLKRNE
jgi:hypothetical protein